MTVTFGLILGFIVWVLVRYGMPGLFTVNQNERAVKTSFGRAVRMGDLTTLDDPVSEPLNPDERARYIYPQLRVIMPGGPYFKWPWEKVYKVSVATETVNMAWDPEDPAANASGTILEGHEQQVPGLDERPVAKMDRIEISIIAGADVDAVGGFETAGVFVPFGQPHHQG